MLYEKCILKTTCCICAVHTCNKNGMANIKLLESFYIFRNPQPSAVRGHIFDSRTQERGEYIRLFGRPDSEDWDRFNSNLNSDANIRLNRVAHLMSVLIWLYSSRCRWRLSHIESKITRKISCTGGRLQ